MISRKDNVYPHIVPPPVAIALLMTIVLSVVGSSLSAGTLYWSSSVSPIRKADVSGGVLGAISDPVPGVTGGVGGIDVDTSSGRIYWTVFTGRSRVLSSKADGTDVRTLITTPPLLFRYYTGIAIDPLNEHMYFADKGYRAIFRADLDGGNLMTIIPEVGGTGSGFGIEDLKLDVTNGHIYWTDSDLLRIRRANLDGSGVEDLVQTYRRPLDIDLDVTKGRVYWSELGQPPLSGAIRSANLDGSDATTIVDSGLWRAKGLAIDPTEDRLYWTDTWNAGPTDYPGTLQSSTLSGENRQILADFGSSEQLFGLTFVKETVPEPKSLIVLLVACSVLPWLRRLQLAR